MKNKFLSAFNDACNRVRKPLIIAEMSGNHNQSLERALTIVDEAAKAGADAIKLQTYTADTMTMPGAFTITDPNSLWFGRELHELYQEAYTPWEWHKKIFERAEQNGIFAFSSPFDESAVDFLEELDVPCYKIASLENTDWPLLKKVAATNKPVIMSTGASSLSDIADAVNVLRNAGCTNLVLLKCTSTYPASPDNTNILTIPHMADLFKCSVGLSDHTMGIGVSVASTALGAVLIEKHFTLSRKDGGVDSAFSIEPRELEMLVNETNSAFLSLGQIKYGLQKGEDISSLYKRSIYASKDIHSDELISRDNIKIIRPSLGLKPKHFEEIIGKKAKVFIKQGTPITWNML
ncbi:MAG: pseudaminic acid synthase [Bacteroidota bacterium]